jgi:hypothetical protein
MYSVDNFFVTHTTSIFRLRSILKESSIQPLSLRKKIFEERNPGEIFDYESKSDFYSEAADPKKYINSIFYGFLFPDKEDMIYYEPMFYDGIVHFIFSSKIIKDNAEMYGCKGVNDLPVFCEGWKYGKIDDKCTYYNCKRSLKYNLNNWRNIILKQEPDFNPWTGTTINEILLEGEMPLDLDLVAIYTPYSNKIKELKEKYPYYNWVHDMKDLKIPNLSKDLLNIDYSF